jgi:hypothetical protein
LGLRFGPDFLTARALFLQQIGGIGMKHLALFAFLSLGVTLAAVAQNLDDPMEIPFRLKGHWIVVKASIGSVEDLELALETGSAISIIDRKIARQLKLKGRPRPVKSAGSTETGQEVTLPQLCLGQHCYESVAAMAVDLRFAKVDGFIGLDLLRRSNFTIDYVSKKILFGPVQKTESSIHFPGKLPFLLLRVRTAGEDLVLMLDSGSEQTILFQDPLSRHKVSMTRTGEKSSLVAVGVRSEVERVYVPKISLGDCSWRNHLAYVLKTKQKPYRGIDGFLALSSLDFKSLSFDFEENQLSWVR